MLGQLMFWKFGFADTAKHVPVHSVEEREAFARWTAKTRSRRYVVPSR